MKNFIDKILSKWRQNVWPKLKLFFKSRKFVYGSLSIIMVIALMGILVVLNLLAEKWDLKVDLTSDKRYSISRQTIDFIKNREEDINITVFMKEENQTDSYDPYLQLKNVLEEYKKYDSNITVEFIDPDKNPEIANKYLNDGEPAQDGMILVQSGDYTKWLNMQNFYSQETSGEIVSKVEQKITAAIGYVTEHKELVAYFLGGHGETASASLHTIVQSLEDLNYKVEDLNLTLSPDVPQNTSLVFDINPRNDISADEKGKLSKYLESGGRLLVCLDAGSNLPQIKDLLKSYNIGVADDVVIEEDASKYVYSQKAIFMPEIQDNDITKDIVSQNFNVLVFATRSLNFIEQNMNGVASYSLAKSSDKSWGAVNINKVGQTKGPNDLSGPLDLMIASEKQPTSSNVTLKSRVVVMGDTDFITDQVLQQFAVGGNIDIFMDSVKWLGERDDIIVVASKTLNVERISPTNSQVLRMAIAALILPLIPIVAGVVVWRRRKHL